MKTIQKWKEDPIVEEVHRVREKLGKEWAKDPKAFNERITKRALDAGLKEADIKPISLKDLRRKGKKSKKKTERRMIESVKSERRVKPLRGEI